MKKMELTSENDFFQIFTMKKGKKIIIRIHDKITHQSEVTEHSSYESMLIYVYKKLTTYQFSVN